MTYIYHGKAVVIDDALLAAYNKRNERPFSLSDIEALVSIGRITDDTFPSLSAQVTQVLTEELVVWGALDAIEDVKNENAFVALRSRTGLSQTKFAAQFGIPVATLRDWEQGRRKPPSYVLSMLTAAVQAYIEHL